MPLPFVLPYAVIFWAIFVWAFLPEYPIVARARKRVREPGSRDAGSVQVIAAAGMLSMLLGFPLAWWVPGRFPSGAQTAAFIVGVLLVVAGAFLRRHCWRLLGEFFTGDVYARPDQPVIARGAYAWVRHPSYSAGLLLYFGIGLALGSWATTLLITAASFAAYSYRIVVEERVLLETLGEPYRRFVTTRKRLIPFLY